MRRHVLLGGVCAAHRAGDRRPGTGAKTGRRFCRILSISTARPACRSTRNRRATAGIPLMAVFNNLVVFDQHVAAEQPRLDRARSGDRVALERGRDGADLHAAPRRQMARRQALHRGRCQMHLGPAAPAVGARQIAHQPAQILVPQRRGGHDRRRLRGHLSPEAAAALSARAARLGRSRRSIPAMSRRRRCGQHPIGTGPFKFVEFKPNEYIKLARNPDYWKPGRPYLDGIEYTIIAEPGDAGPGLRRRQVRLSFTFAVTIPLMNDLQAPGAAGGLRA